MTRDQAIEIIMKTGSGPPLGSAEYREFAAYLETSPECRALYEQQQALWATLDLWEQVDPSRDFDRRLFEKVREIEARRPWYSRLVMRLRPSFAAGLAGLLIAAATVLYQQPGGANKGVRAEGEQYLEQFDRALDDIEMLAEFDVLPLPAEETPKDRS